MRAGSSTKADNPTQIYYPARAYSPTNISGFSLVELSIVLLIIGVLAGAAVVPISATIQQARYDQTAEHLAIIREALLGHIVSTGRLPCPISTDAQASGSVSANQACSIGVGGLPGVPLGVMGAQSNAGALLDAWGREYIYAVSLSDHDLLGNPGLPDWVSIGEPAAVGASSLSADLQLCREVSSNKCALRNLIADQIVWVVFSSGESVSSTGLELENLDNDTVFAVSAYSSNTENPFNDQFTWASRSEIVFWLLKAAWLP